MRFRFFTSLLVLSLLTGLFVGQPLPAAGQEASWSLISATAAFGFGDRSIDSSAIYNDELYVGVEDSSNGCEVWKYDGANWVQVNTDGFGSKANAYASSMAVYDGKLYAGTCKNTGTIGYTGPFPGCEVWLYDGEMEWSQVNASGFGDDGKNWGVQCLAVYEEKLYAGTWNPELGCQVWRYDSGKNWVKTNNNGFKPPAADESHIDAALSMAVYEGKLYVGANGGGQIWCYDGGTWAQENSGNFWQGEWLGWPYSMAVYDGRLLVGLYMGNFGVLGCRVLAFDGTTWKAISEPGFGDLNNTTINYMTKYESKLYAGVIKTEFREGGLNQVGSEIWVYDGSKWTKADTSAFGAGALVTNMTADGTTLYVATYTEPSGSGGVTAKAEAGSGTSVWMKGRGPVASTFFFAEGTCRPNFETYFCIQNPTPKAADVKLRYMKGDGQTAEDNISVPAASRATVSARNTIGTGDDAAHDFSTVVEAAEGSQIIVERPMYFNYNGVWTGGHDVVGFTQ